MASVGELEAWLEQPLVEGAAKVSLHLTNVLERNADSRRFHQFLPRLLARVIGADHKQ